MENISNNLFLFSYSEREEGTLRKVDNQLKKENNQLHGKKVLITSLRGFQSILMMNSLHVIMQ